MWAKGRDRGLMARREVFPNQRLWSPRPCLKIYEGIGSLRPPPGPPTILVLRGEVHHSRLKLQVLFLHHEGVVDVGAVLDVADVQPAVTVPPLAQQPVADHRGLRGLVSRLGGVSPALSGRAGQEGAAACPRVLLVLLGEGG